VLGWSALGALAVTLTLGCGERGAAANGGGRLVVFNAGSLARPMTELLQAYTAEHPGAEPQQENSGSLEAARKLTELGKIPDVIAVADYSVIPKLLMPRFTSWYATFARNAMVLVYSPQSRGSAEIDSTNWWRVLLRPDVRSGHSDPALDPNGYRTLMVYQLAERHYGEPGLAARLAAAVPRRYIRPKEADLVALVQAGELDYAWSYRSLAQTSGLRHVDLPAAVDLSDPARADEYGRAVVRLPGASRSGADSVEFRGEPIVYALSIPDAAPHRVQAEEFVRFVFSAAGRKILEANGFIVLERPVLAGTPPAGVVAGR
jgi:molybdate/tungstate transport system substrate-binding protein